MRKHRDRFFENINGHDYRTTQRDDVVMTESIAHHSVS